MHGAVMSRVKEASVFVATAAVADWRVAHVAEQKIKKTAKGDAPDLQFTENPDILGEVAKSGRAHSGELFCVGFAAESHDLQIHAQAKREKKGVPLLVGNIGPATFGSDENALLLVDAKGVQEIPKANKLELARKLVAEIALRIAH
jgi:phosphopantothenoylcysteine decarboxylase/phosphopantothenate--cysteine ligase